MRHGLVLVAWLWLHLLHLLHLLRLRLLRPSSLWLTRLLLEGGTASFLRTLHKVSLWHVSLQLLLIFLELSSIWVSMKDFLDLFDARVLALLSTPDLWILLLGGFAAPWDHCGSERLVIRDLTFSRLCRRAIGVNLRWWVILLLLLDISHVVFTSTELRILLLIEELLLSCILLMHAGLPSKLSLRLVHVVYWLCNLGAVGRG